MTLGRGRQIECRLVDENRCHRRVANAGLAPRPGGQRQHIGDVARAISRMKRNGDALAAERGVAATGGGECVEQGLIGVRIVGAELAAGRADDAGFRHHGVGAGIGADDASDRIDQEHGGWQRIEAVGESRGLDRLEVDNAADRQGAPEMRHHDREPLAHLVVDESVRKAAKYPESSAAGRRFLEIRMEAIHESLRNRPFLAHERAAEFIARKTLGNRGMHFFDVEEMRCRVDRIDLGVFVDIEPLVMRVIAPAVEQGRIPADHVPGRYGCGAAADEFA
jgi:hypothetical protein